MITIEEVKKLAALSQLKLEEEELVALRGDFESILSYVAELSALTQTAPALEKAEVRNVMRDEGEAHEKGVYTDVLLGEVPEREVNYIKVKKIL